ncbi:MAG: hypothetical protein V3T84_15660 [Phycisphaerales bacterium]
MKQTTYWKGSHRRLSLLVSAGVVLGLASWTYGQCTNACGSGDIAEGEVCLVDFGVDTTGGCNVDPAVFGPGDCSVTICGTASTYDADTDGDGIPDTDRRDTDWYLVDAATLALADKDDNGVVQIRSTVTSEFPAVTFFVAIGDPVCDDVNVVGTTGFSAPGCAGGDSSEFVVILADHPNGIVVFVAPGNPDGSGIFDGVECDLGANDYILQIECIELPTACAPGAGPCGEPNGTPGCEDPECCATVCAIDSFCCIIVWDQPCVDLAKTLGCLPEPILTSADGLWTAELDEFGQIFNFFPPDQPKVDNVFESLIYEANSQVGDMLSRRVGSNINYTVVEGPTISEDGTSAITRLEANDADLAIEIEILMLDGLSGGALVKIRCENTGDAAISCKIFYYCDYDISGDFDDDEATTIPDRPDPIFAIEQIDENEGGKGPKPLWFGGCPDYEGWELDEWPLLRSALNGGVEALANADATDPGFLDHTAALSSATTQLEPGEIVEFQAGIGGVDFVGCEAPPDPCPWDLDGSGIVGATDLLSLLVNWGKCADCNDCPADFDGNCTVGATDLLALLVNWGPCP